MHNEALHTCDDRNAVVQLAALSTFYEREQSYHCQLVTNSLMHYAEFIDITKIALIISLVPYA